MKTAVEFAVEKLEKFIPSGNQIAIEIILEQAKEMEKEQMIEFAQEVFRNRYSGIYESLKNIADNIYNETYEGNK